MNLKSKIGFVLTLLVVLGITIYVTPALAKKVKSSPMHVLYTYNVTKSFSKQTDETVEVAAVPSGKVKNINEVYYSNIKIEDAPRNIERVVAESLNETQMYGGGESTLTGPEKGFSVRKFYRTNYYDTGEYAVTRTNRITGKEKEYTGTYYEPSLQDPVINWSRDYK